MGEEHKAFFEECVEDVCNGGTGFTDVDVGDKEESDCSENEAMQDDAVCNHCVRAAALAPQPDVVQPDVESRPATKKKCDIYVGDAGKTLGGGSHSVVMALDFTDSKENAHKRQWILNIGQQGTGAEHWLWHPASGAIQFGVWNGPQISGVDVSRANHTLATVYDAPSKTYALFIDGKLAKPRSNVTFNIETSVLAAGDKQNFHSDANFNGCISGVDVYSYALTATQVQAVCTKLAVESAILPLWRSSSA